MWGHTDGSVGLALNGELNDTTSARASVGLVLDFSALDLSDSGEELDEILVAGAPGQVLDVNELALGTSARDAIGEGVGRDGRIAETRASRSAEAASTRAALEATTAAAKATTVASASAAETTAEAATATTLEATRTALEAATSTEAAAKATATSAVAASAASVAILADLKETTLPVVAVHDVDGILCILRSVESDDTGSLGRSVGSLVNVSANDITRLAEEILQILPTDRKGKL
jgi:hypothetical protein